MSVLRGLILRRLLVTSPAKSLPIRTTVFSVLLISLIGVFAVSTKLDLSGLAARRPQAENGANTIPASIRRWPLSSLRGPVLPANANATSLAPLQGCTVSCNATVPGTGQHGVGVQFSAATTPSGCSGQPAFNWNFGDGTPHSTEQNPTHAYVTAGAYTWTLTTSVSSGSTAIDTIAGGLGEGNPAAQTPFGILAAIARDPQGRGIYVADQIGNNVLIRFINTSNASVTLGGRAITAGTVRAIAGGGLDLGDNAPGLQADLGAVAGLAISSSGDLIYFANSIDAQIRAINVSSNPITISGQSIGSGRIGTLASNLGSAINGLAVNPSTGDVYFCDATAGINKVFKVPGTGGSAMAVAGNGSTTTQPGDPFSAGPATNIPLLQPRAVEIDGSGDVIIADTGHGRVIRVNAGGQASLINQFPVIVGQTNQNPYPSGVAIVGGSVYVANGNQQTIVRVTGGVSTIAGAPGQSCDYSVSNCGDDGAATGAGFNMLGSKATPPLAGIESDQNGLFILDQGITGRGRVRYTNLTGGTVTVGGLTVAAGVIRTIAGSGLASPYDGSLATGASFNAPVGVGADASNNLWVADTISARLRFVNRGDDPVTIFAGTPAAQTVPAHGIVTVNKNVGAGANDGVPVIQAAFDTPQGLFVTGQGVYVVDSKSGPQVPLTFSGRRTSLIKFINTTSTNVTLFPGSSSSITIPPGNIIRIAGGADDNQPGNGDGGFATNAKFFGASDIVVTSNGTIYVTEVGQKAVRKIDGNTGSVSSLSLAQKQYTGLGLDSSRRLYIANFDDGAILRESGPGSGSFANYATGFNKPRDVAVAADGNAYVTNGPASATSGNHQILRIDTSGATSVIAGSGPGFDGDGGPAIGALLNLAPSPLVVGSGLANQLPQTVNIVVTGSGEIIFADSNNNRIRRLSASLVTCTRTGTITIEGDNPSPTTTSINPTSALINSGAFTLTVNGAGFAPSSVVRWNGQSRPTTFMSSTQLTAAIPSSDVTSAGTAQVTVSTPTPGGGISNAQTFTVTQPNPVPTVSSLNPNSATEGGPGFTLTVNGTGFVNGSVVRWDGSNRATNFVSSTQLTAQILATDIVGTGQASVTVFNPTPGGGVSNVVTFGILSGTNPPPVLTSINPNSVTVGAAAFIMTANGSNFVASSKVRWNGQELQTAFGNANQLTAQVPANLVASVGTAQVTVFSPTPGGGTTAAQTFTIAASQGNPMPTVTGLQPAVVATGGVGFTLTINGTNFINGATVRVNNNDRVTTFVSQTQLTASVLASDIAANGTFPVTVFNPAPGGGVSNVMELKVVSPVASVSAASFLGARIAPESIVAAFGVGMATGVGVASSLPLPTTLLGTTVSVTDSTGMQRAAPLFFVAPSQVNYQVPPGTADGAAKVTIAVNGNIVGTGVMTVARVAPGLFSANANGQGVAAAVVLRIRNGVQSFEPVATFDSTQSRFVPVPIDLGPPSDAVYVLFYGTGLRNRTSAQNISVNLGGTVKTLNPSLFEDGFAVPGFIGLDQANVLLPRTLSGNGVTNVVLTVDNQPSNTIQLSFR